MASSESDIESIVGIKLLYPPLRAPVLAQHTLGYVFSASPTDRAAYFRAVLDTQDLEDFRGVVASLAQDLPKPDLPQLNDLAVVATIAQLNEDVARIDAAQNKDEVERALAHAIQILLDAIGVQAATKLEERVEQLAEALDSRRKITFPLNLFTRRPLGAAWTDPSSALEQALAAFETERAKVDSETRRLITLFETTLAIPAIAQCDKPMDCPVCGTEGALTPERVQHIRDQVAANTAYRTTENLLASELRAIDSKIQVLTDGATQALPRFMQINGAARRKDLFRVNRIVSLSEDAPATATWLTHSRALWRKTANLRKATAHARTLLKAAVENIAHWNDSAALASALIAIDSAQREVQSAQASYGPAAQAIGEMVKSEVDRSAQTTGWEELGKLAKDPTALFGALALRRDYTAKVGAIEQALRQIEAGSGKVADEKFTDLTDHVTAWWDRLRPGELAFFSAVRRRSAKARRTIDLKVTLSAKEDRSDPKLRDAVAVFSQSQLHCLGLSLFLARAIDGGAGFVLLDDPVLTSDDDFRPNFASTVIEALLAAGIQVIVVTQDYASWKDIGHRHTHAGAIQFQMVRDSPVVGSEIRSQNDALATLLSQAQPFINSQDGEQRKNGATKLRQAIERFSKELLVRSRRAQGDHLAMITDYDGQDFGKFSAQAKALLTKDPSHPGKLTAAHSYVTPGPHDDTPPSTGQLKMAAGELRLLKREYLD